MARERERALTPLLPNVAASSSGSGHGTGLLLLLSALAMVAVLLASLRLLRQLAGLSPESWNGVRP